MHENIILFKSHYFNGHTFRANGKFCLWIQKDKAPRLWRARNGKGEATKLTAGNGDLSIEISRIDMGREGIPMSA
jgi:hypothetical protein